MSSAPKTTSAKPTSYGLLRDTLILALGVLAIGALVATQFGGRLLGSNALPRVDAKQLLSDPGEGGRAALNAIAALQRGVIAMPGQEGLVVRAGPITWRIQVDENNNLNQWGGIPEDQQADAQDLLPLRARRIYLNSAARARLAQVTPDQIARLRAIHDAPQVLPDGFREKAAELFNQRRSASDRGSADDVASIDEQLLAHVEQLSKVDLGPVLAKNAERAAAVREILTPQQLNPPAARQE